MKKLKRYYYVSYPCNNPVNCDSYAEIEEDKDGSIVYYEDAHKLELEIEVLKTDKATVIKAYDELKIEASHLRLKLEKTKVFLESLISRRNEAENSLGDWPVDELTFYKRNAKLDLLDELTPEAIKLLREIKK